MDKRREQRAARDDSGTVGNRRNNFDIRDTKPTLREGNAAWVRAEVADKRTSMLDERVFAPAPRLVRTHCAEMVIEGSAAGT